jgi:hypothetical protein
MPSDATARGRADEDVCPYVIAANADSIFNPFGKPQAHGTLKLKIRLEWAPTSFL